MKTAITTLVFCLAANCALFAQVSVDELAALEKTKSLISSLNLLNGLHLSGEQLGELLQINLEARELRRQYVEANSQRLSQSEQYCAQLLSSYSEDRPADEQVERAAAQIQHQLTESFEQHQSDLASLGRRVDDLLTPGQNEIVRTFKPCLIPPRDLRQPSRAGQASAADFSGTVLERYRQAMAQADQMRDRMQYARMRHANRFGSGGSYTRPYPRSPRDPAERVRQMFSERFFPHYFEKLENAQGEMTSEEKAAEQERVLQILDRAAEMSNEEYSLNAPQLAAELGATLETAEEEFRDALQAISSRRGSVSRAGRLLIREDLIPILQNRAAGHSATAQNSY